MSADEEPDVTSLTYQTGEPQGSWCTFCGQSGHRQIACRERPLDHLVHGKKS